MRGKWIVFEGLDGSGTTTQTRLLTQFLHTLPHLTGVWQTSEPTDGVFGTLCRDTLKHRYQFDRKTLALAFSTDRSDHLHRQGGILDHLKQGEWVIQDRYLYSTLAYQDGEERAWLHALNQAFPRPDLVVYLDTPLQTCLHRIHLRNNTPELFETPDCLRVVAQAYSRIMHEEAEKSWILKVDGTHSIQEIYQQSLTEVKPWLPS